MDEKELFWMTEGMGSFQEPTLRPLGREIVEYILKRRFGKGSTTRGRLALIFGIVLGVLSMGYLILFSVATLIAWIVFEAGAVMLIVAGVSGMRNAKPNESKIAAGSYYLKETVVTAFESVFDSDAADSHDFTFADGEKLSALQGNNCDSLFYRYGGKGDPCYLLFFGSLKDPVYVFDAHWWVLQPELEGVLKGGRNG